MHAVLIERIPAAAAGRSAPAIALHVGLAEVGIDDVVLARDIEGVEFRLADRLIGIVEFLRF